MIKQILLFALVVIIAFLSCSSNKKLVVEQTNSNYPIILVKGKKLF